MNPNDHGAWIAYYSDWSGMAVFADELNCLRYAVEHRMDARFVPLGADLREAVNS